MSSSSKHVDFISDSPIFSASCAALIVTYLISGVVPLRSVWGANHSELVSPVYCMLALIVVLALATYSRKIDSLKALSRKRPEKGASKHRSIVLWVICLISMVTAFVLLRSRMMAYGDGYLVIESALRPLLSSLSGDEVFKPLTVVIYRFVGGIGHALGIGDIQFILALISVIAGLIAIIGIGKVRRLIVVDSNASLLFWMSATCTASFLVFFGHIEHYALAIATVVWIAYYAIIYQRNCKRLPTLFLLIVLGTLLHGILACLIALPIGILLVRKLRHSSAVFRSYPLLSLSLIVVFSSTMVASVTRYIAKTDNFLSPLPIGYSTYWAFSWSHLVDTFNALLFAAPLALVLLSNCVYKSVNVKEKETLSTLFLIFILIFVSIFWLDPQLGAARDWDILTLYAIPLAFLATFWFVHSYPDPARSSVILQAGVVSALYLYLGIFMLRSSESSLQRLDRQLWVDPHYQESYESAKRSSVWGVLLSKNAERPDMAVRHLNRRLTASPNDDWTHYCLGNVYLKLNDTESAIHCYMRAHQLDPHYELYIKTTTEALKLVGRHSEAEQILQKNR